MLKKQKQNIGFTLIELLVVIGIISNLSVIAIVNLNDARARARDAARLHDLNTFSKGLELYFSTHGLYPCGNGSYDDASNSSDQATVDTTFSCQYENDLNAVNMPGFLNGPGDLISHAVNCASSATADTFGLFKEDILYSNCPKDPRNGERDGSLPGYGYVYTVSHDRLSYTLATHLERGALRMQSDTGICPGYYEVRGGAGKNNTHPGVDIPLGLGCGN